MDEQLRSKHAFGSEANVSLALQNGLIDAYDILFLDGDTDPKIGWIDKNGNPIILPNKNQVIRVDALPAVGADDAVYIFGTKIYVWDGEKFVPPTDCQGVSEERLGDVVDEMKAYADAASGDANTYTDEAVAGAKTYTDSAVDEAKGYTDAAVTGAKTYTDSVAGTLERVRYEFVGKPDGTLVNYGDREIRVLCPKDTVWVKQSVAAAGNANMYYLQFRAYAPEGAVAFREGDQGVIEDEVFDFNGDFAGTDEYGRNYSVCWLAAAVYDPASGAWTYFGKNSSDAKYIGWTYVVEWMDASGRVIDSGCVRINLTNEDCHYTSASYSIPGAIAAAVEAANAYTDEQVKHNAITVVEF